MDGKQGQDEANEGSSLALPSERTHPIEALSMPDLPFAKTKLFGLLYGDKHVLSYTKGRGEDFFSVGVGTSERKVVERFPLTEEGWTQAFKSFADLEPDAAEKRLSQSRREMHADQWRQQVSGGLAFMPRSLFLGGHGLALNPSQSYDLLFDQEGLLAAQDHVPAVRIPYESIEGLEISGRGEVKSGGGFVGGGFGFEGAATGIAIASLLNAATTSSRMETVLRLEASDAEAFFHYGRATPEQLRIQLSPVFGRVRKSSGDPYRQADTPGIADQILKLADLRREGLLSAKEFEAAKRRMLEE